MKIKKMKRGRGNESTHRERIKEELEEWEGKENTKDGKMKIDTKRDGILAQNKQKLRT